MADERLPSLKGPGKPAAPKITFKPKAVARRKKEEAPASSTADDARDAEGLDSHMQKRAQRTGQRRVKREETLTASGPFAQGPAQAAPARRLIRPSARGGAGSGSGSGSSARRGTGTAVGGSSGQAQGGDQDADKPMVDATDDVLDGFQRQSLASLGASTESYTPDATPSLPRMPVVVSEEDAKRTTETLLTEQMALVKLVEEDDADGQDWFMIQMPQVLPYWVPDPDDVNKADPVKAEPGPDVIEIDQRAAPANDPDASAHHITAEKSPLKKRKKAKPVNWPPTEGTLGGLCVHKSGKMSMDFGDIRFYLGSGQDVDFPEECVAVGAAGLARSQLLGFTRRRLVATPDLNRLLPRSQ